MRAYVVRVTRVTSYVAVTDDAERAVDLVLGVADARRGESVVEEDTETINHGVEETQASRKGRPA